MPDRGKPCRRGYDSHYCPGGSELVFFHSDQLCPLFLADAQHIKAASAAAEAGIKLIAEASGNTKPRGKPTPDYRSAPAFGPPGPPLAFPPMAAMFGGMGAGAAVAGAAMYSAGHFTGTGHMLGHK